MRDHRLLDESINLSSAIQLSGYPSVVGSLWNVTDSHASDVARNVYRLMLGDSLFDPVRSSEALHHVVRQLRDETRRVRGFTKVVPNDPLVWASFIHIGI